MKKEFREITSPHTVQVTIADERWYSRTVPNPLTGLPELQFVPSVTWIASHYPKGIGFYKWLANTGWEEAEAVKVAAGDKGSRVHRAVVDLIDGQTIPMEAEYPDANGIQAPLSLEEYDCLRSFADFWTNCRPETLDREVTVFNNAYSYGGTLDWVGVLHRPPKGLVPGPWLLDWKTSKDVWPEHEIQISAYAHSDWVQGLHPQPFHLGILQLGYRRNQAGWKLTEVDDQFPLFLAARQIWQKECAAIEVFRKDYPLSITLPPAERRA